MKLTGNTYKKIIGLLLPIVLVIPALIFNIHVFSDKHTETAHDHHHDLTTFCSHEISICKCNALIIPVLNITFSSVNSIVPKLIFKAVKIKSIEKIYFNFFLRDSKGRSPPQYLRIIHELIKL